MRSYEEYKEILSLWDLGCNKQEIARITRIPRTTVSDCINRYGSLDGLEHQRLRASKGSSDFILDNIRDHRKVEIQRAYTYLLGLYLGDGVISRMDRVHRLRITLDKKYPDIIGRCKIAIEMILPNNQVGVVDAIGCVYVSSYYKFWPYLFPQDGEGRKHEREIRLVDWQQVIVDRYPIELLRGLFHSDGSRDNNKVNGKNYPRYSFRNFSTDILDLYCQTCDQLGLHWTLANNGTSVNVAKRKDVEYLDRHIGPKA